jgi:hypothetical protein
MEFCEFLFFFYEHIFKRLNFHNNHPLRDGYNDNAIALYPCQSVNVEPIDVGPVNTDHCYSRRAQ